MRVRVPASEVGAVVKVGRSQHCGGRPAPRPGEEGVSHGPKVGAAVTFSPWPTLRTQECITERGPEQTDTVSLSRHCEQQTPLKCGSEVGAAITVSTGGPDPRPGEG